MPTFTKGYRVERLSAGEEPLASRLFSTMAEVFEEEPDPLSDGYVAQLLVREDL